MRKTTRILARVLAPVLLVLGLTFATSPAWASTARTEAPQSCTEYWLQSVHDGADSYALPDSPYTLSYQTSETTTFCKIADGSYFKWEQAGTDRYLAYNADSNSIDETTNSGAVAVLWIQATPGGAEFQYENDYDGLCMRSVEANYPATIASCNLGNDENLFYNTD